MLKKLIPLLSIFSLIILLTFGTALYQHNLTLMNLMMLSMAFFFLVFGLFKLNNLKGFAKAYAMYDVIAMKSKSYAIAYPFIEIVLGLMYIFAYGGVYRDIFTFIIMSVSGYGVWKALQAKEEIQCACLGTVFKVPMTKVTLSENLFMAFMALYMINMYFITGGMSM
ncbi:hypothetical protein H7Y21_02930 [Arenimonas sp.]|nr:hypothetical protein [Candidatus Parcubacteria bacterium]